MTMKKIMWAGFSIQIIILVIILLLVVLQKQIPDLVSFIFVLGMLTCIISSFFVAREKNEILQNKESRKKYFVRIFFLLIPIIIMLFITHYYTLL